MVRNEAVHRYALHSLDIREEAPEEMVLKRMDEEFGPKALRVENILGKGSDVEMGEVRSGVQLLGFRCRRLQ